MKILVVDDQWELLQAIGLMLELDGFQATLACGGEKALEKLGKESFDLLLCDVQMPCLTGPELFWRIQNMGLPVLPRFIFMSGNLTLAGLQKELGIHDLLLLKKPFDLGALRAALQRERKDWNERRSRPGNPPRRAGFGGDQEAAI